MRDEIALSVARSPSISVQFFYAVKLMETGSDLSVGFLFGILVHILNDLGVIFYDSGEHMFCKDFFPEIICHKTIGM